MQYEKNLNGAWDLRWKLKKVEFKVEFKRERLGVGTSEEIVCVRFRVLSDTLRLLEDKWGGTNQAQCERREGGQHKCIKTH